MKRIALLTCFLLSFSFLFAQYPATQTLGSDSTLIKSKGALQGRLINWSYPDTASANRERISHYPGAQITVGDLVYFRNSDATRWILLGSNSTALNTGLTSTGNITLVDSTLTIGDTIRYTINGMPYVQTTPSVFTINSADSGYYRKDLIYADATGLHKLVGEQDTAFGVKPKLPINSIEITTVDIYGQQIVPPTPTIITPIPNLQQVTNEGNSTTNPIFINSNSIQTPLRITSDFNRSNYLYFKNNSNGGWANTGFLFKNDVTDNPYDEWSGHWFRLMQGSTNSSMIKDGAIIMTNGTGGMKIVSDSGRITFNSGSPAYPYDPTSHPYKEMGAFETDGSFRLNNYKNNAQGDSVLSTDTQGKVVMKKVSVGDIDVLQNTIDSSSFGIKKLDGTVKNVVVYADGLTGIDGNGTQVNSDWNATSGVAAILNKPTLFSGSYTDLTNKPTIPAPFNPIAGTNMTITGTYPNLTFNSTASGGGSTYTASNGLTMVGNDMQLGGTLSKKDTISTGTYNLSIIGSPDNFEGVIYAKNNISARTAIVGENSGNNIAIYGINTGQGSGIGGYSSLGWGVSGSSVSAAAGHFVSNTGNAIEGFVDYPNVNEVVGLTTFSVGDGLAPSTEQDGLGGSYNTVINNGRLTNSNDTTLRIISKWSSVATRTSEYELWTMKDSSLTKKISISGNGLMTITNGVLNLGTQFTPANSTDNTFSNKTISADDTYLYYRKSDGTWVKIAWTTF